MGWLFYDSHYRYPNGRVNRKQEMDSKFTERYTVLKSTMSGSTYYAALKDGETGDVTAYVALTSSDSKRGHNFGYKGMCETAGPYCHDCPKSILDLLTPIENDFANAWRERCRERITEKKLEAEFAKLPEGTVAIWTCPWDMTYSKKGDVMKIKKGISARKSRKLTYWYPQGMHYRIPSKFVKPKDCEIVRDMAA
jgi:hypothetical protein